MDGTIDSPNSMGPLKNLGFDHQQIAKIAVKLDAHSVQCAYKHVGIWSALEKTYATSYQQS